jgi:hypothetical protein
MLFFAECGNHDTSSWCVPVSRPWRDAVVNSDAIVSMHSDATVSMHPEAVADLKGGWGAPAPLMTWFTTKLLKQKI